jgi:O-antigen ligase
VTTTDVPPADRLTAAPGALFTALSTAAALAFAAFYIGAQSGGTRAGVVEVLAVVLATTVFARAAFNGTLPRPFNASLGMLLMALFAALTALSVGWSLLPNASLLDAVRLISYTCVVALAALLAQLHQERAREILLGIGLAALVICGYALFSRCFPGLFGEDDDFARLRLPFGYWNAVGCVAAIGLLVALWAGTRRRGPRVLEVVSYPAGGLLVVALMLSQSRGALLALAVVVAVWFVLSQERLRSAGWLAVVGFCSMLVVAWAYGRPALSTDAVPLAQRETAGLELTVALVLLVALLCAAGALVVRLRHKHPLTAAQRSSAGRTLLILAALAAFALVLGIGIGTERHFATITDGASGLFSTTAQVPGNSPDRLTQTTSLRGRYWSDSYKIFKAHSLHGTGGDTFLVARLPYRHDQITASHAHGMVPQVAADLGVLGLVVLLALTAVWLVAAFKLAGASRRGPHRWLDSADETRSASVAIMLVGLLFGLHSALDWVWFMPGVAYFGLLAGGWVLGTPAAHSAVRPAPAGAVGRGRAETLRAVAITVIGVAIAYAVHQPVRAERKVEAGIDVADSQPQKALRLGRDALKLDPTSADAYILIAVAGNNSGRRQAAEATLVELTQRQPGNPAAWLRLARFRLQQLQDPDGAIRALRPVLYQSPNNLEGLALLAAAREAKADALLQKLAEQKRRELQHQLDRLQKLRQGAAAAPR